MRRLLIVGLMAATSIVGLAPASRAHAELTSAFPASGAQIDHSPGRIVLQFDEPVTMAPGSVIVTAADGARVDKADTTTVAAGVVAYTNVLDPLPAGVYTVQYAAQSADGHTVSQQYQFRIIGAAPERATPDLIPPEARPRVKDGGVPAIPLSIGAVAVATVAAAFTVARSRRKESSS